MCRAIAFLYAVNDYRYIFNYIKFVRVIKQVCTQQINPKTV